MEYGCSQGPVGQLEWMYDSTGGDHGLILCHPHSLYGSSMHDGVLEAACEAASRLGISTVRFNFRGVGSSEGNYDDGKGEVEDLSAILAQFREEFSKVSLIGYSFGAGVAGAYASSERFTGKLMLIAPPASEPLPTLACETLILVGDNDAYSDAQVLQDWAAIQHQVTVKILDEADHFFAGYRADIVTAVEEFLS